MIKPFVTLKSLTDRSITIQLHQTRKATMSITNHSDKQIKNSHKVKRIKVQIALKASHTATSSFVQGHPSSVSFFESNSEIRLQLIHIVIINIHVLSVICIPFKDKVRRKHHLVTELIFDGHARFFVVVVLDFLLSKHVLTCGIVHKYPIMFVSIQLAVQVTFAAPVHVPALKILACKNMTDLLLRPKRIGVHWRRKAVVFLHAPGPPM